MARSKDITYIYHLPHTERKMLSRILDRNDKWEELGEKYMKYDFLTIQEIRRVKYQGGSPTEELLTMWGQQNHTVEELFILLYQMKHYQAMTVIKDFVDVEYRKLIQDGKDNLHCLIKNLQIKKDNNDVQVIECDKETEKLLNVVKLPVKVIVPPMIDIEASEEDNERVLVENKNVNKPKSPLMGPSRMDSPMDMSTVVSSAGSIPQITYAEIQEATNNWDQNSILGKGGFGTVYRGIWKCTQVAIKRLDQREKKGGGDAYMEQMKQSITELQCLNAYRHDNILALYGCSIDGPHHCLVYQYMSGGCLEHRLHVRDPVKVLNWPTRLKIAIGTARGLQFLHTIGEKPLIHGDIKSANILLDPNDMPKIGDFGLAKQGPESDYTHMTLSKTHGTRPYVPDEFLRARKFSTKVDTYSFGVVLFELATALRANLNGKKDTFLRDHVMDYDGDVMELKDKRANDGENCFLGLLDIGKMCVNRRPKDRPEMVSVLINLEQIKL